MARSGGGVAGPGDDRVSGPGDGNPHGAYGATPEAKVTAPGGAGRRRSLSPGRTPRKPVYLQRHPPGAEIGGSSAADKLTSWISRIRGALDMAGRLESRLTATGPFRSSHASETGPESYLRESMLVAISVLDQARDALREMSPVRGPAGTAQVRRAIDALSDAALWDELLERHRLSADPAARTAARGLAERIVEMSASEVPPDCLPALLGDIELLRQFILAVSADSGILLSPNLVRDCLSAASGIGTEVMIGLIAMLASQEAAGTIPARTAVVCAAIGISAGATVRHIWERITLAARAHTLKAQLQLNHQELRDTIGDLAIFLGCLCRDDPPSLEELELASSVQLAAKFRASHSEQLAAAMGYLHIKRYCEELARVKGLLDQLPDIISAEDHAAAQEAIRQLKCAHSRLDLFTHSIDELKTPRRLRLC